MSAAVSIVIPVYNREHLLAAALASAQAQTFEDLEILVVDNCSTDGTADVARAAARRDRRVRLHVNERNVGVIGNFRRSLGLATGSLVKLLMSDDLLAPDAIAALAPPLADHRIALSTSKRDVIDLAGDRLPDVRATAAITSAPGLLDGRQLGDVVLTHNCNVIGEPSTVLFRRRDLDIERAFGLGGVPWRTNLDVALWLSLLQDGHAWYDPQPRSFLRLHPGQDQQDQDVLLTGAREWFDLVRVGRGLGFLADDAAYARALTSSLRTAIALDDLDTESPAVDELWRAVASASAELSGQRGRQSAVVTLVCRSGDDAGADLTALAATWATAFPEPAPVRLVLPVPGAREAEQSLTTLAAAFDGLGVDVEAVNDVEIAPLQEGAGWTTLAPRVLEIAPDIGADQLRHAVRSART